MSFDFLLIAAAVYDAIKAKFAKKVPYETFLPGDIAPTTIRS